MDPILNKEAERLIWIAEPSIDHKEGEALAKCIADNWISQGPRVAEFEDKVAKTCNRKYGSACNSGTTALHLALHVCDVGAGDEVIIPNLTMIAVANAVLLSGATPVFAESDVFSPVGNVSIDSIKSLITNKTKAIIIVHTYGEPLERVDEFGVWCREKGIKLIEDCAEAHFATLKGRPVGCFGDLSIFSFYSNKNITTGEGGMVITDSKVVKDRLDRVRMHAFTPGHHFHHTEKAFGYRMTDMQAAIGLEQLKKAPRFMATRKSYRILYEFELIYNNYLVVPHTMAGAAHWVMPLLAHNKESRDKIRKYLADNGVDTRTYFQPFSEQEFLKEYITPNTSYGWSNELADRGFYVGLYPKMKSIDVLYICDLLNKYKE